MSQERDDVQSHSCKSRQGCATKRPGRWVLPRSIARENASGAAPAGTLRALHYLLVSLIDCYVVQLSQVFYAASFSCWYQLLTATSAALMDLAKGSWGLVARVEMTAKPVRSERL
jgi:hypothetical protein